MSEEKISLSQKELDNLIQTEVNKQRLEQLGTAFKQHMLSEEVNWSKVFKKLDDVPKTIQRCRVEIEKDIEAKFMSHEAGVLLETKLESKIDSLKNRIVWSVGTIVAVGGAIQFVMMLLVMAKKIGG